MKPTQITIPFANSGLKNDIPDANGQIGQATWQDGFPQITMQPLPPEGDGVPPDGMDMNGVLYEISKAAQYSQMGVLYKFDSSVVAAIGGYPKGAVLLNDAENAAYLSLVDSNTYNFNEQPSFIGQYWRPYAGAVTVTTVTVTGEGNAITDISAQDGALTATKGSFLPITGGEMSGAITRDGVAVTATNTASFVCFYGGTASTNGAGLFLYGDGAPQSGRALLRTAKSGEYKDLVLEPSGEMSFGGQRMSAFCLPSADSVNLTLGTSGASYTAADDGWVMLSKSATAAGQYIYLFTGESGATVYAYASGANLVAYIPVTKGRTFRVNYTAGGATNTFVFTKTIGRLA